MEDVMINFNSARFKHMNWKFRLRGFLDGKESLSSEQALSHTDCDLGKWYYQNIKDKYGSVPEMAEFEQKHEELHNLVQKIVTLKEKGEKVQAEKEYKKIEGLSKDIVELLNKVEAIVNK